MADYGFDTIAVRGGYAAKDNQESVAVPVILCGTWRICSKG